MQTQMVILQRRQQAKCCGFDWSHCQIVRPQAATRQTIASLNLWMSERAMLQLWHCCSRRKRNDQAAEQQQRCCVEAEHSRSIVEQTLLWQLRLATNAERFAAAVAIVREAAESTRQEARRRLDAAESEARRSSKLLVHASDDCELEWQAIRACPEAAAKAIDDSFEAVRWTAPTNRVARAKTISRAAADHFCKAASHRDQANCATGAVVVTVSLHEDDAEAAEAVATTKAS